MGMKYLNETSDFITIVNGISYASVSSNTNDNNYNDNNNVVG